MLRSLVAIPMLVLAAACVSTPIVLDAMADPRLKAVEELECMGDCLEEPDGDCESCAARCLSDSNGALNI